MSLIVRKYGGSSVATIPQIKAVAQQIKELYESGKQVICVVSAMGKTTDKLHALAKEITTKADERELDMLLSIGERKSISLMALALNSISVPAVSFTGSQIGLITNQDHGKAEILEIKGDRIRMALDEGKVAVVAGYQGVSIDKEITTLGRGGTDTTAIALAACLNADRCELMKDVDGIFSIPPALIQNAYLRKYLSYDELLNIAEAGSEIVAFPAVKLAKKHQVKLSIGNSYTNKIGTQISPQREESPRKNQVVIKDLYLSEKEYENVARCISLASKRIFLYDEKKEDASKFRLYSILKADSFTKLQDFEKVDFIFSSEDLNKIEFLVAEEDIEQMNRLIRNLFD